MKWVNFAEYIAKQKWSQPEEALRFLSGRKFKVVHNFGGHNYEGNKIYVGRERKGSYRNENREIRDGIPGNFMFDNVATAFFGNYIEAREMEVEISGMDRAAVEAELKELGTKMSKLRKTLNMMNDLGVTELDDDSEEFYNTAKGINEDTNEKELLGRIKTLYYNGKKSP